MARDVALSFGGEGLTELSRDLQGAAKRMHSETQRATLKVGEEVAEVGRTVASAHGSKTIPPTIHVIPSTEGVLVRAGSETVAIAALWELGNKGKGGRRSDTFRHPVFGNRNVWVEQARHPFLRPALTMRRRDVTKFMNEAYDRALDPYRLAPSEI